VFFFKPFKTTFKAYKDIWNKQNKGKWVRKEDLAQWVSLGLQKEMTPSNIKVGFATTGIWPLDPSRINKKMGPSEGFVEKLLDV